MFASYFNAMNAAGFAVLAGAVLAEVAWWRVVEGSCERPAMAAKNR